jgi:hypothetical protein
LTISLFLKFLIGVKQALATIKPDTHQPELYEIFTELLLRIKRLEDAASTSSGVINKVANLATSNPSISLIRCWEPKAASSLTLAEACNLLEINYYEGV